MRRLVMTKKWIKLAASGLAATALCGFAVAEDNTGGVTISSDQPMNVWDQADMPSSMDSESVQVEQEANAAQMKSDMDAAQKDAMQKKTEAKSIMEGSVKAKDQKTSEAGFTEPPLEKYLEPARPPKGESKVVDIYLENKSQAQGFLTGFTTKRADTDLRIMQHPPSDIPAQSKFQIANFGNYIRLGHEASGQLIGYSTNYFGFTSVYLAKEYYEPKEFWTRFIIAPSGQADWYLIRSYTNPKKCLTIGWSEKLRLKRCNIKDQWQQFRFLREKADAYWVPEQELIDLDII